MKVRVGLAVAVLCLVMVPLAMSAAVMSSIAGSFRSSPRQCGRTGGAATVGGAWAEEQRANAAAIVQAGATLQVPPRGWVIAVATAMQESRLVNVSHGDTAGPDSRGLFQQRDSWGPESVRMDPAGAAGLFYARLVALPGWETMALSGAAQAVQISAYPDAYSKWEDDAQTLVGELAGSAASAQAPCGTTGSVDGWALPLDADHIDLPLYPCPPQPRPPYLPACHHDYPAADIGVPVGAPVYALTAGAVRLFDEPGGCGYGVAITDRVGAEWIYCHVSRFTVTNGAVVDPGQQVAASGGARGAAGSGSSTGPHLHVQVRAAGGLRCPQPAIEAVGTGQPPPPVAELPDSGCVG